jgi:hypothetical protein
MHCFQLFVIACEARERSIGYMTTAPNAAPSDALVAVVFAAFAAEAFVNELSALLLRESLAAYYPPEPAWAAAGAAIRDAESTRDRTSEKFTAAHRALTGSEPKQGREPYQSFDRLMKLRDWIGHTKPERNPDDSTTIPPELRPLFDKGLTYPRPSWVGGSWMDLLLTDRIADWACRASLNMMRHTLTLVPGAREPFDAATVFLTEKFAEPCDRLLARGTPSAPQRARRRRDAQPD